MADKCYKCFRPMETCYCKYIKQIETGIKFVFLIHPKEAYKQKTGTGRLAQLSLPDSELIIGVDFTQNKRIRELLSDERYFPVVMYPGEDAWTAGGVRKTAPHTLKEAMGGKQLLVFLVDATWACAKKMLRLSPNITSLQKISFTAGYRSEYTFKKEPAEDYLSTIETCYYLIKELQSAGICPSEKPENSAEPLMDVFRRMVKFQIESQKEREAAGLPDRYQVAGGIRAKRRALREARAREAKTMENRPL
ncbi:MAG: DTW domain-containing protein [Spirochaetaceae bacterium]|nr:DTW domain-containing protein [Spirochaetaceae bacterium]